MAILALEAGKHVYVEKPCSHNPAEGVMLLEAVRKYGKQVQMGTQQRSSPHTMEVADKIHNGLIGRAYYGKAWYSNVRKSIGHGKAAPIPPSLNWDPALFTPQLNFGQSICGKPNFLTIDSPWAYT